MSDSPIIEFKNFSFPDRSIILDPWRYLPENDQYTVIPIGKNDF